MAITTLNKLIFKLFLIFTLLSCSPISTFTKPTGDFIKVSSEASNIVNKGIAIKNVSKATKTLAETRKIKANALVLEAKNTALSIMTDKELKIASNIENSKALDIAILQLDTIKDEKNKINVGLKILKSRQDRVDKDSQIELKKHTEEQLTLRAKYYSNKWLWGIGGVLIGLILANLFLFIVNFGNRIQANVRIKPN